MSATAPKTLPPQAAVRDLVEEQRVLTRQLTGHADPHIRLLVHISERQLAFNELLLELRTEFRTALEKNTTAIGQLTATVTERGVRQDEHEKQYPLENGSVAHADAQ